MTFIESFYDYIGKPIGTVLGRTNRDLFNHYLSENQILPKMEKSEKIQLSINDICFIKKFAIAKMSAKEAEFNGRDDDYRLKREMTGATIEYTLLKKYGKESYFDNSIVAQSKLKNYPDLMIVDIMCDVKGSDPKNSPLIFNKERCYSVNGNQYYVPNVIGVTDNSSVWLLGIATPEVLHNNSDVNLVKIAEPFQKTGFYGFDKLIDLPNKFADFSNLCNSVITMRSGI